MKIMHLGTFPASPLHAVIILLMFTFLAGCTSETNSPETAAEDLTGWESFGDQITLSGARDLGAVIDQFDTDEEKSFKITGTLTEVCQSKGCWTTLSTDDGRSVRMTFANYSFFLPVDAAGREIVAEGVGFKKLSTVSELRHYAEDAKADAAEIAAITEPQVEYVFEARGVLLR